MKLLGISPFTGRHAIRVGIGVLAASVMLVGSPSAVAETALEKIKRTGKVTVGTEAAFPPFEFIEDGKIVGYGKDILTYIIDDMGVELNQLDLPWQGILRACSQGSSISSRPR